MPLPCLRVGFLYMVFEDASLLSVRRFNMRKKKEIIQHGLLHKPEASILSANSIIAGLDEVGRGCLAGPVVAGAVVFPEDFDIVGLDDSKALTEKERLHLGEEIKNLAWSYGIGLVWMDKIQEINILQASLLAMARALAALKKRIEGAEPKILLIDGTFIIPHFYLSQYGLSPEQQTCIISGDSLEPSISAASILAKNFRDSLMVKMDTRYPGYGFASHKGYGTKEHREALEKLGPCPLHRMDFRSVKPVQKQGRLC